MYALYVSIQVTYKESQSLKGLAKMKYDKEHKESRQHNRQQGKTKRREEEN